MSKTLSKLIAVQTTPPSSMNPGGYWPLATTSAASLAMVLSQIFLYLNMSVSCQLASFRLRVVLIILWFWSNLVKFMLWAAMLTASWGLQIIIIKGHWPYLILKTLMSWISKKSQRLGLALFRRPFRMMVSCLSGAEAYSVSSSNHIASRQLRRWISENLGFQLAGWQ